MNREIGIALAMLTGVLWSGVGIVTSRQTRSGAFVPLGLCAMMVAAAGAWMIFPAPDYPGGAWRAMWLPLSVMLLVGMFSSLGMLFMNTAMRMGHHSSAWTIGQSALIMPFLVGCLAFADHARWTHFAGIAITLAGVRCVGWERQRAPHGPPTASQTPSGSRWLVYALLSFGCFGMGQTLSTIPSRVPSWQGLDSLRVPLMLSGQVIIFAAAMLGKTVAWQKPQWWYVAIWSMVVLTASAVMFQALDVLSVCHLAGVVHPIAIGTCIAVFALYRAFIAREIISRVQGIGIALATGGVIITALP